MNLTAKQAKEMQHAIGFQACYAENGAYTPYRNFFEAGGALASWESLVEKGLAVKNRNFTGVYYSLTAAGIALLSEILNVKIYNQP